MTGADRGLLTRALQVAGYASDRQVHAADIQALLVALIRLAQRQENENAHLRSELAGMTRPAGWTGVERGAYRALRHEVDRMRFRLELNAAADEPVPYTLTGKAEAEIGYACSQFGAEGEIA